jgi:4-amino-4-deoxy-L-arabinose transferase-like glycosyltransferase
VTEVASPTDNSFPKQALIVSAATLLVLAPFLGRAFNIDETLFLKLAHHLHGEPWDFYGFSVNWIGISQQMFDVTRNPPLGGYYLAAAAALFGWSEWALHAAFLLPAIGATLGVLCLARRFCERPIEATLIGVLSPVFLMSSVTVMCDTLMLCLWCWAIVCWLRGIERDSGAWIAVAAVLIGVCGLTKYFGASLLPLLIVYTVARNRHLAFWVVWLVIPVAMFAAYEWHTAQAYGRGLLLDAAGFVSDSHREVGYLLYEKAIIALTFAGGCVISVLFCAPLLWSRRVLGVGMAILAAVFGAIALSGVLLPGYQIGPVAPSLIVQYLLAASAGIALCALAVADLYRNRDATSLLLALWVLGTFVFAGFLNWTNNGRSILPMAPAVGILIARRLESASEVEIGRRLLCYAPGVLIALGVVWADHTWAGSVREAAREISTQYRTGQRPLWFLGHWGFQHYMEEAGAMPLDVNATDLLTGDLVVRPSKSADLFPIDPEFVEIIARRVDHRPSWAHTMDASTVPGGIGAGFYSSLWGPLPFAFGVPTPDEYLVLRVKPE